MLTYIHRDGTIDWQGRQHQIDFVLTPYYAADNLDFDDALDTLKLTYRDTLLYTERTAQKTTGLDALAVRPAQTVSNNITIADPALPVAATNKHLSLDAEGLVLNADATCVYETGSHFLSFMTLLQVLGQRRVRPLHLFVQPSGRPYRDAATTESDPPIH